MIRLLLLVSMLLVSLPAVLQAQRPTPIPDSDAVVTVDIGFSNTLVIWPPPQGPGVRGLSLLVESPAPTTLTFTWSFDAPAMPAAGSPTSPTRHHVPAGPATIWNLVEVTVPPTTPVGTDACVTLTWQATIPPTRPQTSRHCTTVVTPDGQGAPTPTPTATPTAVPTTTPTPTATPTAAPTATPDLTTPCWKAAQAAISKQGAIYSQGGALASDPINPRTGRAYPRTGPDSFDCSGLIWWAYQQADITVGTSTYTQVADGHALPCTLDDLQGDATRCWAPGDLIFLRYPGAQHVAMYVGSGLFMDCYNHQTGCVLHDVSQDRFYRSHFWQARRIIRGCEGMTLDPGAPVPPPLPGDPEGDEVCVPDAMDWPDSGVAYHRGCGPPVLPPDPLVDDPDATGTTLRQFDGVVGWLGTTGRMWPPDTDGVHLHLGVATGAMTNACQWPNQVPGYPDGTRPPGAATCWTDWADPLTFLPQSHADTLALVDDTLVPVTDPATGDPSLSDTVLQLPPPGHPAGLLLDPPDPDDPGGTWWSPGNADRADGNDCPLGGPATTHWFTRLLQLLLPWLFGC